MTDLQYEVDLYIRGPADAAPVLHTGRNKQKKLHTQLPMISCCLRIARGRYIVTVGVLCTADCSVPLQSYRI